MLNLEKSRKYWLLAIVIAGCIVVWRWFDPPYPNTWGVSGALQHSPPVAEQIAGLLPPVVIADSPPASPTPEIQPAAPLLPETTTPAAARIVATAPQREVPPSKPTKPVAPVQVAVNLPQAVTSKTSIHKVDTFSADGYKIAVAIHNRIAQKYEDIAQQTGYLEQYPELSSQEMTEYQGQPLAKDAAAAFVQMRRAADRDGISLSIVSGFRSIGTQATIFDRKGGNLSAAAYSAPPGHSQHHTGLAIDINSLSPSFRETAAFRWLQRHGAAYGFMLSYANNEGDLGPRSEPWHWVYVGKSPAMQLMNSFIGRARKHHYDPLLGDPQLEQLYRSTTNLALQPQNRSKS